ncbi:MAG: hypothetical protein ABRQ33_10000, partial [Smithellaceae bacterium]
VIHIRNLLKPVKGRKMGYDGTYLYIFFQKDSPVDPAKIIALYRKKAKELRFTPDYQLSVFKPGLAATEILEQALLLLKMLAE